MSNRFLDQYSKVEESEGLLEKTGDFFQYGAADSVISAGVSFYNTGIALGNMLGGEGEYVETADVVYDSLGEEASQYYKDNQDLVDVVGLIGGSLLPGLGAIKMGKMAAAGISSTRTSRLSTGIKDTLLPDRHLESIKTKMVNDSAKANLKEHRLSLAIKNAGQGVAESALYETATLLTMNQSSALTREDVGYLEAIGNNLDTAAFGVVFGAVLGGGIGYLTDAGKLKTFLGDMQTQIHKDNSLFTSGTNSIAGDEAIMTLESINQLDTRLAQIEGLGVAEAKELTNESSMIKAKLNEGWTKLEADLNKASVTNDYGTLLLDSFKLADTPIADRQAVLAGAAKLGAVPISNRRGLTSQVVPESQVDLPSLFTKNYGDVTVDLAEGVSRMNADLLSGRLGTEETQAMFLESAGLLAAQDIKQLWKTTPVRVQVKGVDGKKIPLDTLDPADITNFKLPKPRKGGDQPTTLSTMLDVRDELRSFAAEHDPVYMNTMKQYDKAVKSGDSELLGDMWEEVTRVQSPEELFSSAYRTLNASELDPAILGQITGIKGKHKVLYDWLDNNKALKNKYGQKKAYAELKSGKITNTTPAAVAPDLGPMRVVGGKVEAGAKAFNIKPLTAGLHELPTHEASAHYVWAASEFGAVDAKGVGGGMFHRVTGKLNKQWEDTLTADNLPALQAVRQHYDFQVGDIPVKLADGTTQVVKSTDEMNELVSTIKRDKILEFSASGKHGRSLQEVSIYVDASEEYVNAIQSGLPTIEARAIGEEYLTGNVMRQVDEAGRESFSPLHVEVSYDQKSFDKFGDRDTGISAAMTRTRAVADDHEMLATKILGNNAELFPTTGTTKEQAATMTQGISTADETTTVVRSFNADMLSGLSLIQSIGQSLHKVFQRDSEKIYTALSGVGKKVNELPEAIAELSILQQSVLRSGKYKFFDQEALKLDPASAAGLQALGIDTTNVIQERVIKANGFSQKTNQIIETDAMEKVLDSFAKGFTKSDEELQKIAELSVLRMTDEAAEAEYQAMRLAAKEQIDSALVELNLVFTQKATAGGQKTVHQIKSPEVAQFLKEYHATNQEYIVDAYRDLNKAWGRNEQIDPDVIYPGKFDAARFKHVAYVRLKAGAKDPWAGKDAGVIVAHDTPTFNKKIQHFEKQYNSKDVEIITNQEKIASLKAKNQYDSQLAVTDSRVNVELQNDGKLWDVAPELNQDVVSEMISGIAGQRNNVLRQTMKLKYGQEYATLEQMHRVAQRSGLVASKDMEHSIYSKAINQMLAITDKDHHSWWHTGQEKADMAVGKQWRALKGSWIQAQSKGDWETFAKIQDEYGLPKVYEGAEDFIMHNAKAPRPVMQKVVSQSNGIFSLLMLRLDQAHAMVNAMSFPIMAVPEIKNLVGSIKGLGADKLAALELATTVPTNAAGSKMPSNGKILQQATNNLFQKPKEYIDEYVTHGILGNNIQPTKSGTIRGSGDIQDLRAVVDEVSYSQAPDWHEKVGKVANTLASPVDYSEGAVKFIAADAARQILDIAGVPSNHPMYWATIKTFVSRTHGNYNAAQRPTLFQGWAGQAIGLFQTYQFNLFQQFMKHVEDGNGAAKHLAGLQVATFGHQSMPGFQLMNQHLGERTNGEKDIYSTVAGGFDNPVADFVLYGGASSLTRPLLDGKGINFYTRGNLTPRTPILIPTSFDEVPVISFYSKMYDNIAGTMNQVAQGANAGEAFMHAVATNGVNRPLAGAAQIWNRRRTTAKGTTLFNYTDMNYANIITKLMGTSTLDESIAVNAFYRSKGYRAKKMEELQELGQVVKTKIHAGEDLRGEELQNVMTEFTARGGNQRTFRRWMQNNYTNANESAVLKLRDKLDSPEGNYLQTVMGGATNEFDNTGFVFSSGE